MTPKKARQLEEYAYLWESGEWKLQVTRHSRERVIFEFPQGRPTTSDLVATRALIPRFTNAPVTELKTEIGSRREFVVGDFPNLEARRLVAEAKVRGLTVRTEDASVTSCLPVTDGACLHIDDADLARLLEDEMERRGVPIIHADSD
jgi:hypothetical protein